jgi:cytochrome oxidase Cu insertion factor (SCO1/SenC/PrrC family)
MCLIAADRLARHKIESMAIRQTLALISAALLFASISSAEESKKDGAQVRKLLSDASSIGLAAGTIAPRFALSDQNGRVRDLSSLAGPKGLVLVFFRSADW